MDRKQLVFAAFVVAAYAMVAWQIHGWWKKRRARQRLVEEGRMDPRRTQWKANLLMLLVAVTVAPLFYLVDSHYGHWRSVPLLFVISFIVFFVRALWYSPRDEAVIAAQRLHKEGKTLEGITRLRSDLAQQPTALRAQALAVMLETMESWEEAAAMYARASELDGSKPVYLVQRALAMSKMGKSAEALEIVSRERARWKQEAALALIASILLADLGRWDEGAEQVRQAEEMQHLAADEQQVDIVTMGLLTSLAKERMGGRSARAFPVEVTGKGQV